MKPVLIPAENKFKILKKNHNIKSYFQIKNKVLIIRNCGGIGDLLVHRMLFEDFHKLMPDIELTLACPKKYHILFENHPFLDKIIDSGGPIDKKQYMLVYNTSTACREYEMSKSPYVDKNRSDIWAEHCGVRLTTHNMHLNINPEYIKKAQILLNQKNINNLPTVMLAPYSSMKNKDLTENTTRDLIEKLKNKNLFPFLLHNQEVPFNVCNFTNLGLDMYLGLTAIADYVISVDTGQLHLAAGLNKPLVGIFTNFDGKQYGKYYNFELVQMHRDNGNWDCGPCHNFYLCPKSTAEQKPCCTLITSDMILSRFNNILAA